MEMGSPQMGLFLSPSPFPYGEYHMETVIPNGNLFSYGDFFLNSQMVRDTIWKWVRDWIVPIWKPGMCQSPFPYGNAYMETGD